MKIMHLFTIISFLEKLLEYLQDYFPSITDTSITDTSITDCLLIQVYWLVRKLFPSD